jgi:hypothetical protein
VHRPRRSPSLFATPTSSRARGQGSRPRWVRDTAFSLRGRSRRAATLGPRYGALAQRQVGARGGAGSAIRRSRSVGGRGARPRWVRDTAFSLNGGSRRAGTLRLPTSVLENVGPVLGSWRSFTRLALRVHSLHLGPRYLTRRCSGRYASAPVFHSADSNHLAPGQPRGTRSAAELHVVRQRWLRQRREICREAQASCRCPLLTRDAWTAAEPPLASPNTPPLWRGRRGATSCHTSGSLVAA